MCSYIFLKPSERVQNLPSIHILRESCRMLGWNKNSTWDLHDSWVPTTIVAKRQQFNQYWREADSLFVVLSAARYAYLLQQSIRTGFIAPNFSFTASARAGSRLILSRHMYSDPANFSHEVRRGGAFLTCSRDAVYTPTLFCWSAAIRCRR